MMRIVLSLLLIAALSPPIVLAKEKLNLLSTIKPIHSLVSAISGELAEAKQIIPNNASPHHYSLKPSDLRRINKADLIFRIDPKLESFLSKSLRSVDKDIVITLSASEGLTLLHAKEGHAHEEHDEEEHHETEEEDTSHELDYHLWLNPDNAISMANTIRDELVKIAPEHKTEFSKNTDELINRITIQSEAITKQLDSIKNTPFLVMHDAWQYFTQYYQLNQLGSISAQERLSPSAKALSKARAMIADSNVKCLLAEPNLKQKVLTTLTEGLTINVTELDPLGRNILDSNDPYPQLLQYTADKLLNCLTPK